MSKDVVFRVEISFKDSIKTDEGIMEVAQKIADALEHEVNHGNGLAPEQINDDEDGTYTEHIRVTPNDLNKTIIVSFR